MVIEEHARLEITLPDGRFFEISEKDIINNSLSITSQCVNGNTIAFGCVQPAQLSAKFRIRDSSLGRYDIYGAEVVIYSYFGSVPPDDGGKRGVFNVTSITKNNDIFTISASDNICWLDSSAFEDDSGNNLANSIYTRLDKGNSWHAIDAMGIIAGEFGGGVIFNHNGLAKERIPNGTAIFKGYGIDEQTRNDVRLVLLLSDEQSDNVRDYVSWLAEYMGGFVCADNNGEIQFRLFETPCYDTADILNYFEFQQNTLEIAGFRVYFYGSKIVTEDNSFYSTFLDKSSYSGDINIEAVVQNNPFVEFIYHYNASLDLFPITLALNAYQSKIPIRPFSGTYHGNKYFRLGQYIKIRDKNGTEYETVITNIMWKFRSGQQIKCTGEDSRTLSQARKRTQAVRMGERIKTQLNRLEDRVSENNTKLQGSIDSVNKDIKSLGSTDKDQQGQISYAHERIDSCEASIGSLENQLSEVWQKLNGGE